MVAFFNAVARGRFWKIGLAPEIGLPALSRKIALPSFPSVTLWISTATPEGLNTRGFPPGPVCGFSTSSILLALSMMTGSPWGPACAARRLRNLFTPPRGLHVCVMKVRRPPASGGETSKNADESNTCAPPPQ